MSYEVLDDLGEDMISLREICIEDHDFTRRRRNPVVGRDEWDFHISAGTIARDFYTEVLQRLFLI